MGVPRSNGCLLCVQRRVKCDEKLPGCARCETYGKPCPGYDRGFKFVVGKPYRSRRPPRSTAPELRGLSDDASGSKSQYTTKDDSRAVVRRGNLSDLPSAHLQILQGLDILVDDILQPFSTSSAYTPSRWFQYLPSVYGKNKTLDCAIKCFSAHHIGTMTGNDRPVLYARRTYVEALNRLQRSLCNKIESLSSEILCAVLLLCLYELFTNKNDSTSWMKHAKGLGQFIQIRGCHRYQDTFDHAMLHASRGIIVMHSVFANERCFLNSDDWHFIMRNRPDTSLPANFFSLVEDMFAYLTAMPSLVHEFLRIIKADPATPEAKLGRSKLLEQALHMQQNLLVWYNTFTNTVPLPTETLSATGDTLHPIVYYFPNVDIATIYCAYYSYMALIHAILQLCDYPGDHTAMVVYFRDQICKSVEYNSRGILGPYRLGFHLHVVYELGDPVTKAWVKSRLQDLSRNYAALLPENFL
ncbi:putative C6 finger domain protein [Aspergillus avenaceus]|uniref:Putative C6 finger domain protein n=1 Tax=Aspergillus avenaceus TaxID=36643 RepID=A0A5N6TV25_ASPAV|nr:putative C6 finger domain protein [Aspergillus avenaceus]